MKKALDLFFGGRRVYITVNALFAATLAVFVIFDLTFVNFYFFMSDISMFLLEVLLSRTYLILPYLLVINTAAFFAVKKGSKAAIVLSLLLGFIGSFIAGQCVKKDFFGAKVVNIIFIIYYWLLGVIPFFPMLVMSIAAADVCCTFVLFFAIMFLLFAGISRCVPAEKIIVANLSVNALLAAAAAIFFTCTDAADALYEMSSYAYYLEGYGSYKIIPAALSLGVFLIAFAPNYFLYSKYRKAEKGNYSLKTHLAKTAAAFFCNYNAVYIICFIMFSQIIIKKVYIA